ncbi:MAG: ATP-binding protein, partial [Bacteroidota bacterium]
LTESNELLEQYAHLASHDLRSPIQNIINFSDLLKRRLKDKLSTDELEFINYISEASQRLKQTTSDLLKVATIQHQELNLKWCDPKQILEEVLEDLEEKIIATKARIEIANFPDSIKIDQHTIHLVFQNLIANSLKFAKEGEVPKIEIGYEETADQHAFIFQDDGIGIAEADQAHIFKLFRRVNEEGQYEGTGMGLAICLRMIRRLHGDIEVQSQLGKGSTFKIEVPKQSVHSNLRITL